MCCHIQHGCMVVVFLGCCGGCVVRQRGCTVVVFLWGGGGCVVTWSVVILLSFCGVVVDVLSHSVVGLLCFCGVVVDVLSHSVWLYCVVFAVVFCFDQQRMEPGQHENTSIIHTHTLL